MLQHVCLLILGISQSPHARRSHVATCGTCSRRLHTHHVRIIALLIAFVQHTDLQHFSAFIVVYQSFKHFIFSRFCCLSRLHATFGRSTFYSLPKYALTLTQLIPRSDSALLISRFIAKLCCCLALSQP